MNLFGGGQGCKATVAFFHTMLLMFFSSRIYISFPHRRTERKFSVPFSLLDGFSDYSAFFFSNFKIMYEEFSSSSLQFFTVLYNHVWGGEGGTGLTTASSQMILLNIMVFPV